MVRTIDYLDALADALIRLFKRNSRGLKMGFREMKAGFEADAAEIEKLDVFRRNYLRCLFEIAGNLDTVALCSRALVEQSDKTREILSKVEDSIGALLINDNERKLAEAEQDKNANRKKKV